MCKILFNSSSTLVHFTNREGDTLSLTKEDFCVFKKDQPDVIENIVEGNNAELFLHALAAHLGFTVKKIGE